MKLGELINTRRRELGLTLDEVAIKARSSGYTLSKATLSAYATQELAEPPRTTTMQAMALALDVSYAEVVLSVAESLIGTRPVEISNEQHVQRWLTLMGGRSDAEVASVMRVVQTMAGALDAAHEAALDGSALNGRSDERATSNDGVAAPPE